MNRQFLELFRKFMNEQKKRKLWKKAVTVLAGFVVFFTVYALVLPAITMESGNTDAVGITLSGNEIGDEYDDEITVSGNTVPTEMPEVPEEPEPELVEPEKIIESEKTIEKVPYKYEDDELAVEVTLPEGSSVPEGAVLRVRTIVDTDDEYEDLAKQAEEAVDGQAEEVVLYDISFYTVENEYIPVAEEATVSFQFKETVFAEAEGEVTVLHYEEEGAAPVELAEVEVQTDENDAVEAVTFQTEGFSVFAVVKVTQEQEYESIGLLDIEEGEYYIIRYSSNMYFVMTDVEGSSHNNDNLKGMTKKVITSLNEQTLNDCNTWIFEYTEDSSTDNPAYYISTQKGDSKQYLKAEYLNNNAVSLVFDTVRQNATKFSLSNATDDKSKITIGCSVNGKQYYINNYGGDTVTIGAFVGYDETHAGSGLSLYEKESTTVNDLAGKSFAIVSNAANKAISVSSTTVNEVSGLNPIDAAINIVEDQKYVVGDNIPIWTFEATETKGVYYISTETTDGRRYLTLYKDDYRDENDGRGSLTLEAEPQGIKIIEVGNGCVYFSVSKDVTGASQTSYINLDSYYKKFWTWNGFNNYSEFLLCEKISDDFAIAYNLNLPGPENEWAGTAPNIPDTPQMIKEEGNTLYDVQGTKTADGYFVFHDGYIKNENELNESYRSGDIIYHINTFLRKQNESYGREYRFDGWTATINGNSYLFKENAEISLRDEKIYILDSNGNEVEIPDGTIFNGKWTLFSDVAMFFVNYKGTILDSEGDVNLTGSRRGKLVAWTPCAAVGRLYYGKAIGSDNLYSKSADAEIKALFKDEYDPNDSAPQLVIKYVSYAEGPGQFKFSKKAEGINPAALESAVLDYLRISESPIHIGTDEVENPDDPNALPNNPPIDPKNADGDHYSIRWYTMKRPSSGDDGWHIDGVLVAKSSEVEIIKTFSGVEDTQADAVMEEMDIDVNLGIKKSDTEGSYYTINKNDTGMEEQYKYNGKSSTGIKSYSWTLHAVNDEQYEMTEKNYDLDGYNCSTVAVVRTKDGLYHEVYSDSTSSLKDAEGNSYLIGGIANSVSFNNFYTKERTGAFNIVKRDAQITDLNDVAGKLKGAEFTLTKISDSTQVYTATSNINGSANFNNIPEGKYTLKETTAPTGYVVSNDTWTVDVTENASGKVSVKVTKDNSSEVVNCYVDNKIQNLLYINNTPDDNTVTITKEFVDITAAAMNQLKNANEYAITMTSKDSTGNTYKFKLNDATNVSTDLKTYTWLQAGVPAGDYTIREENFRHASAKDTTVNASTATVSIDYLNQTAQFDVTLSGNESKVIRIKNNYTDEFTLKVKKHKSGNTGDILTGAEFKVYGSYLEGTSTDKISYVDPDSNLIQNAFYIGDIVIGDDGTGTLKSNGTDKKLNLSDSSEKHTYVLTETKAPDGYALLTEPIVIKNVGPSVISSVSGAGATGVYNNGVFEVNVPNTSKTDAKVSITAKTEWVDAVGTPPEITLNLYRGIEGAVPTLVTDTEVVLNGEVDSSEVEAWKYTWDNQDAYDSSGQEYIYYVKEASMDGFRTEYSEGEVSVGTETVGKTKWDLVSKAYEVTIKNYYMYELPETGGSGTLWYTIGGLALTMTAALMFMTINEKKVRVKK